MKSKSREKKREKSLTSRPRSHQRPSAPLGPYPRVSLPVDTLVRRPEFLGGALGNFEDELFLSTNMSHRSFLYYAIYSTICDNRYIKLDCFGQGERLRIARSIFH